MDVALIARKKEFWNNENSGVLKNIKIVYREEKRLKWLEIPDIGEVYFNGGDLKGYLDKRTIDQFKGKKSGSKFTVNIFMDTSVHKERGFYHYNPHRLVPDSVFAVKIVKTN